MYGEGYPETMAWISELAKADLALEIFKIAAGMGLAGLSKLESERMPRYRKRGVRLPGHQGRMRCNAPPGREEGKVADPNGHDLAKL